MISLTHDEIEIVGVSTISSGGVITVSGDRFDSDFTDPAGLTDFEASATTLGDNMRLSNLAASADGSMLHGLTLTGGRTEGAERPEARYARHVR